MGPLLFPPPAQSRQWTLKWWFRTVLPSNVSRRSQLSTLCWLGVAIGCAVGFEGGRPWLLWDHWGEAWPVICFRAAFVVGAPLLVGTLTGLMALAARVPTKHCRITTFRVSVGLVILGCSVDFAWPPPHHFVSIWLPLALFAPRIAQKIANSRLGFWDEPD